MKKRMTTMIFTVILIFTLFGDNTIAQKNQSENVRKRTSFKVLLPNILGIPNDVYQKISQLYVGCPRNDFLGIMRNSRNFRTPFASFREILKPGFANLPPVRFFEQKFKANGMFTEMYFQYQVDKNQGILDYASFWFGKENVNKPNQYETLIENIMDYFSQKLNKPTTSQYFMRKYSDTPFGLKNHMIIFDWGLDKDAIIRLIYPPLDALPRKEFYITIKIAKGEEVQDVFPNKIPDSYKEVQPLQESQYKNYSIKIKKNE